MILVIDNYDSFTYNIVQELGELGATLTVYRNDKITVDEIRTLAPERIVISPGPGFPIDAGVSLELIRELGSEIPLLGVCLGHQAIGQAYGGLVVHAPELMHGKTSMIYHDGDTILGGIPNPFEATRYHSLIVEEATLPDCLQITARTETGEIMGLRHRRHPVIGLQFHPESVLTGYGLQILGNFLNYEPISFMEKM
ncbi:MAG: aminodeoxychorismate/anthranilate synthase component II [Chloroflexi bacterium]|nr:aminodeoxychorismate/anthranilate synthase component II [Chloroflexota bacterium]